MEKKAGLLQQESLSAACFYVKVADLDNCLMVRDTSPFSALKSAFVQLINANFHARRK